MKKIIIPRKDHEVYFFPKPENVKNNKQLQLYITENMEKTHPAFSVKSKIDIRSLTINEKNWLMITVMEEEVLAEYLILNNRSKFYTNTSILIDKKGFVNNGLNIIDDEKIGFDTEKDEPVSIPLEINENIEIQELKEELKTVSSWRSLFKKKTPGWVITAAGICAPVILFILILLLNGNQVNNKNTAVAIRSQTRGNTDDILSEKFVPPILELLATISADIVSAGGQILQWQCDEDNTPYMTVQLQGIDILNIYRLFNEYEYAVLQDIQEIRYGDNEPYITVILNIDKTRYITERIKAFPVNDMTFSMITELSGALINSGVSVISETLPAAGNGYLFYTINYSAMDWNLVRSLEIISDTCDKYNFLVKNFGVNTVNNRFNISCTLAYRDNEKYYGFILGNDKYYIPLAFGDVFDFYAVEYLSADSLEYNEPVIGSISDNSGRRTFFRSAVDGKIQVRVE